MWGIQVEIMVGQAVAVEEVEGTEEAVEVEEEEMVVAAAE